MVITVKSRPPKVGWVESWKEESGVERAWMTVERTAGGVTYEARTVCQAVSPQWSSTCRAQQNGKLVTSGDAEPVDMDFGLCRSPGANPHGTQGMDV